MFYDIGKNMMLGLKHGIEDHAHQAADQAVAKAKATVQKSSGGGGGGGGGVSNGLWAGMPGANKKLMQQMAGAYGWGSGVRSGTR